MKNEREGEEKEESVKVRISFSRGYAAIKKKREKESWLLMRQ
jgi:hypothetical protein